MMNTSQMTGAREGGFEARPEQGMQGMDKRKIENENMEQRKMYEYAYGNEAHGGGCQEEEVNKISRMNERGGSEEQQCGGKKGAGSEKIGKPEYQERKASGPHQAPPENTFQHQYGVKPGMRITGGQDMAMGKGQDGGCGCGEKSEMNYMGGHAAKGQPFVNHGQYGYAPGYDEYGSSCNMNQGVGAGGCGASYDGNPYAYHAGYGMRGASHGPYQEHGPSYTSSQGSTYHGHSHPKHDAHQYGQFMGLVNDAAAGKVDPARVISFMEGMDARFWKGALIGIAATLLFTNDSVKNTVIGALSGVFGMFGKEEKNPAAD